MPPSKKASPPKLRSNYIESAVHLLIAYGGVIHPNSDALKKNHYRGPVNYHGGVVEVDYYETVKAAQSIIDSGINYGECTDPAQHVDYAFNGTFTSTQLDVSYL